MADKIQPHAVDETIACEVCLKEIPRDLAKSETASEVVYHFCGVDCYAQWKQGSGDRAKNSAKP